ncbi:hypothetical protein VTN00DRAFT_4870 [Thermoascus crustaceus]|uniref:uncharacterized protein n=1 Tax=Thermoascus crustaceus TaxID=5088 RepID=UPI0037428C55
MREPLLFLCTYIHHTSIRTFAIPSHHLSPSSCSIQSNQTSLFKMHFPLILATTLAATISTASAWKIEAYQGTDCSTILYSISDDTAVYNCTNFSDSMPLVGGVISTHSGDLWPEFFYRENCEDEPGVRFDDGVVGYLERDLDDFEIWKRPLPGGVLLPLRLWYAMTYCCKRRCGCQTLGLAGVVL